MKKFNLLLLMVLMVGALTPMAKAQEGNMISMAVVDIAEVMTGIDEQKSIKAKLSDLGRQLDAERAELSDQIKLLRDNLQNFFRPGTKAYDDALKELQEKSLLLEFKSEYHKRVMQREIVIANEALYRKIVRVIGELAEEKKIDLVLYKDSIPVEKPRNDNELQGAMMLRKVLYVNEAKKDLNITRDVITRLNNQFRSDKANS